MAEKVQAQVPAVAESSAGTPSTSFRERLRVEWEQYVATGPVWVDGVLAANKGDALPASHPLIEQWVADGIAVPAGKAS